MITGKNYIGNSLKASGSNTHKTIDPKLNIENPTIFVEDSNIMNILYLFRFFHGKALKVYVSCGQ